MAITATTTPVVWRVVAGSTIVFLTLETDGGYSVAYSGQVTSLGPVQQIDAQATAEAYAVLLETATLADNDARQAHTAATTYIHDAPSRLANQPQ